MKATAAAPAKATRTTDTVVEYVLRHHRSEEDTHPLLSDPDLDVVKHAKIDAVRQAQREGRARPELSILKRTCTYPLGRGGQRMAEGSTCDESEVE